MTDRDPNEPGYGSLKAKSDEGLIAEWWYWNNKINVAKNWGSAIGAANEFRTEAVNELRRRGLKVPV